ncbi:MAG: hypothetical protein ACXWG4_03860 [Thermoanaerobaculia bacterium]
MMNEAWPEFVTEDGKPTPCVVTHADLTGWETVVFHLEDHEVEGLLSALEPTEWHRPPSG